MKSRDVDDTWEEACDPFQELIVSWNGKRPAIRVDLWVRLKIDNAWSPWQLYASWGNEQRSYRSEMQGVKVFQDVVQAPEGKWATGFQIRTTYPLRLHAYTPSTPKLLNSARRPSEFESASAAPKQLNLKSLAMQADSNSEESRRRRNRNFEVDGVYTHPLKGSWDSKEISPIFLEVPKLSQMTLSHPRRQDLCSPTSTACVIRYLGGKTELDPGLFADQVRDREFDIFGNWVLNVAQASHYLGADWDVWVERLTHPGSLYDRLVQKTPVIVSVRGPLIGSAQPYARGHLLVVRGMDQKKIYVMDPAFASDESTYTSYPIEEFLAAWQRRGFIAYIFQKLTPIE